MCGNADVGIVHRMMDYAHDLVKFLVPMILDDCCVLFELLQSTGLLPPPLPGGDDFGKNTLGSTEPGIAQAAPLAERNHGGNSALARGSPPASASKMLNQPDAILLACDSPLRPAEILKTADGLAQSVAPESSFASNGYLLFFKSNSIEQAFQEWFAENHVMVRLHAVLRHDTHAFPHSSHNARITMRVVSSPVNRLWVTCLYYFACTLDKPLPSWQDHANLKAGLVD